MRRRDAALTTLLLALLLGMALAACRGSGEATAVPQPGSPAEAGQASTITAAVTIPPGETCPNGGIQVDSGIDENGNGSLDPEEVDQSQVLCNGANGAAGADGSNGVTSLVVTDAEPPGANCATGGIRVRAGADTNGNGKLDAGEVTSTQYVCNTASVLIRTAIEAPGANCPAGGLRIEVGPDANANAVLDPAEISATAFVCNPVPIVYNGPVFVADKDFDEVYDLYASALDGRGTVRLSRNVRFGFTNRPLFKVSPDGSKVAFLAEQDTPGLRELYVVDLRSPSDRALRISGAMVAGGEVFKFEWSPLSDAVAFLGAMDDAAKTELYHVRLDLGLRTKKSGTLVSFGNINDFQWSPDGSQILYSGDQDVDNQIELYVSDASAPSIVKVSGTMVAGGNVIAMRWNVPGTKIAFLADRETDGVFQLYQVEPTGANLLNVSGNSLSGGSVLPDFAYSDQGALAYRADHVTAGTFELFLADAFQPNPTFTKISAPLTSGGNVTAFQWRPQAAPNSQIAYLADQEVDEQFELYVARIPGEPAPLKFSGTLVSGGDVLEMAWSADGRFIAFRADKTTDGRPELWSTQQFSAATAPTSPQRQICCANPPAGGGIVASPWRVAPQGNAIAYIATARAADVSELFVTFLGGFLPAPGGLVSGDLVTTGGNVTSFAFSPGVTFPAFVVTSSPGNVAELFTGIPGNIVNLSGPLVPGGDVYEYGW